MPPLRGIPLALVTCSLSLASFMQVLDYSIANVSIPYISGDLAVSNNQGTWVITSFAVGNAIALPLTGWLAERMGAVKLIVLSMLLFTFFSWICGAAYDFPMLLAGRFFQGFVAGPLIPLNQSLLMQSYPPEKRAFGLSIFQIVVIVAPILGPILGGWITEEYAWRWIFYINIPVGLVAAAITWKVLKDRETATTSRPSDWVGLILLAIGISALQILLDKGEQLDWLRSPIIKTLGITSLICLAALTIWELYTPHPLLDLRLLKKGDFAAGTAIVSLVYMIYFGAIVITPLWLQTYMGYTSLWAGLTLAPMGIFPLLLAVPVARLMKRIPSEYFILTFLLMVAGTFFLFAFFTTQISFEKIALSRLLLGLALAFYFTPIVAISHRSIPEEKLSSAAGLFHFFRIFSGGAGTSLFVYWWDRRAIFHYQRLGETLTPYTDNARETFSLLAKGNIVGEKARGVLSQITQDQAYMLATNDIFWLAAWLSLSLILLLFFFRKKKELKYENI